MVAHRHRARRRTRPATEQWYHHIITSYVTPHVGHKKLTGPRSLTPADVEAMTTTLTNDGNSHRTAIAARTTLSKLLRAGEQRGLVGRNAARLAKPPRNRGEARKIKAMAATEVATLLEAITDSPWHPIVIVGVTTGLRPGELLALHWDDIKLEGSEPLLSVRHALTFVNGPQLKAPKRDRSYRTVPLVPEAVSALNAWSEVQTAERLAAGSAWSDAWPGLVFTNPEWSVASWDRVARLCLISLGGVSRSC